MTATELADPHSDNVTAAAVRCNFSHPSQGDTIEEDLDQAIDALQQAIRKLGKIPPQE